MDLYKNKEVKNSTILILISNAIILTLLIGFFFISYDKLKVDHIQSIAGIVGSISEKYPNIQDDVVSLSLNKADEDSLSRGREILKDYGYSTNLNMKFIGNYDSIFRLSCLAILIIVVIYTFVQLYITTEYHKQVYLKINKISKASKEILSSNYDVEIEQYEEGEFSKLSRAFTEMKDVIKNQMNTIKEEKNFLVQILSDISHQLKTPLASTMIFNEILMNNDLDESSKNKFLEKSRIQLERMEWLIKSLLKLSKIDAKSIKFNKENMNLNDTSKEVVSSMQALAQKYNVKLVFKENKNAVIYGDKEWIQEAIINIVKNAIEHSKNKEVCISIEKSSIYNKLIIEDSGEGIKEEDLTKIFTRFFKSNKPDSVGIGLSLSKSIIEAHDGYIDVSSQLNVGSRFKLAFLQVKK